MAAHRSGPWSREEVEATLADYLLMLRLELAGQPYNKSAHHRDLAKKLDHRTPDAVGMKHQNISAILLEKGFAYIPGYKPMGNYQLLLSDIVLDEIERDPTLDQLVLEAVERSAVKPDLESLRGVRVDPPRVTRRVEGPRESGVRARRAVKRDYLVSRNEVAFSEERDDQFVLARVHEFRRSPKFFELKGAIRKNVLLDSVSFVARL
jgi:hypothetical protein